MAKEYDIEVRSKAVGMLMAGKAQKEVAEELGVNIRTLKRWWALHKAGKSLGNKPGRGRKSTVSKIAKIVIAKSVGKRRQSARKLAKRLTRHGYPISRSTVNRYLKENLGLIPYKPQIQPKLTKQQMKNRLKFCLERKNWTFDDWKKVMFSDESPFELFHSPNRQNDRVWAQSGDQLDPTPTVKFPLKIQVWGLMSYRALSELHVIPRGQTVTGQYYTEEILEKSLLPALNRTRENGSTLKRKLMPSMSEAIYQQDGAPAHHSRVAQQWCQNNLEHFWPKGVWPGNSPDLSPIENLWAIVQEKMNEMKPATCETSLIENVKKAWASISPEILENLMMSMPSRVKKCIQMKGGYTGK